MRKNPNISSKKIITYLNTFFGLSVQELEQLGLGADPKAVVYHVQTDKKSYFLKIRHDTPNPAMLQAPHYLRQLGISQVIAPLPTLAGDLYIMLDDHCLILYDWVDGTSGWDITLSDDQWRTWGQLMRRIHQVPITAPLASRIPLETFIYPQIPIFQQVNALIQSHTFDDPTQQKTAQLWKAHQATIDQVFQRLQAIAQELRSQSMPFVLCHADIHKANIMLDTDGQIHIVDWDGVIIAPPERDLMFFADNGIDDHKVQAFFDGYGQVDINPLAITYYRYEWVVQEFADYGGQIFLDEYADQEQRQSAYEEFAQLFASGDVVDQAFQSDNK